MNRGLISETSINWKLLIGVWSETYKRKNTNIKRKKKKSLVCLRLEKNPNPPPPPPPPRRTFSLSGESIYLHQLNPVHITTQSVLVQIPLEIWKCVIEKSNKSIRCWTHHCYIATTSMYGKWCLMSFVKHFPPRLTFRCCVTLSLHFYLRWEAGKSLQVLLEIAWV